VAYRQIFLYAYTMNTIEQAISKAGSGRSLARALDVSPNTISLWKRGLAVPSATSASDLEDFLGIPGTAYRVGKEAAKKIPG
jgi:ribosome-binding protein aMBF1 (putative translation factor)